MQGIILSIYQDAKARLEAEKTRAIEEKKVEAITQFVQPEHDRLETEKQNKIAEIEQTYEDKKRLYKESVIKQVEETVAKQFNNEIAEITKKIEAEG